MTREELRNELKKYKEASKKYNRSKRELEELETLLESVSVDYTKTKVKSSPEPDTLGNSIDKLSRLHHQIIEDGNDAIEQMFYVRSLIDKCEEGQQKEILFSRYLECKYWEVIAWENHYSLARVHQLERQGLDQIIKRLHTITH